MRGRLRFVVSWMIRGALVWAMIVGGKGAFAQTGSISGVVRNERGEVVARATVVMRNVSAGEVRTGTTDEEGRYNFPSLVPGEYEIDYEFPPIGAREDMLEEAIQIVRGMLEQGEVTFGGDIFGWRERSVFRVRYGGGFPSG